MMNGKKYQLLYIMLLNKPYKYRVQVIIFFSGKSTSNLIHKKYDLLAFEWWKIDIKI